MKKTKKIGRLSLNKSTVVNFSTKEMSRIQGGHDSYFPCLSYDVPCDSRTNCTLCNCKTEHYC